jgi:prepilin-type processing-associated H-X9-DG protein
VLVALALLVCLARPGSGQPAPAVAPTRSLNVAFADGRVTTQPIERTGEMWTPLFPRLPGPVPTRSGQPLSALAVSYQTEGEVIVATVSLIYGSPHRLRVKVATLTVSATPAAVNELRAHGVQPVVLSVAAIAEGSFEAPAVSNVSKALTVTVAPLPPGASRYRFTIANSSSRTLTAFRYLAYRRGSVLAISGMPRGPRGAPLAGPGGSATFVLTVGSGSVGGRTPGPPGPISRIDITAVIWGDGFEGDRETAEREERYRQQVKHGLERALPVLRQSAGGVQDLRSRLSDLSADDDPGTRQIANILLADLARAVGPLTLDRWLAKTIPVYEQWLARLSPPQ